MFSKINHFFYKEFNMERRDFIRLSVASAGASLIAPAITSAAAGKPVPPAADLYYTKEAPGRWAGKVATHLPNIEISKTADSVTVKIVTPHEMKGYEHYIVKHVLLDKDYKFLNEQLFDPTKDSVPSSEFSLKSYTGTIFAVSMCNKHDVWVNSAEV
jgi:superoxide reductase